MLSGIILFVLPLPVELVGLGVFLALGGGAFYVLAIRCPECNGAVMWPIANGTYHEEGQTLGQFQKCPSCGFDAR